MGVKKFLKGSLKFVGKVGGTVICTATGMASSVIEYVGGGASSEVLENIGHTCKSASFNAIRNMWGKESKEYSHSAGDAGRNNVSDYQAKQARLAREANKKLEEQKKQLNTAYKYGRIDNSTYKQKSEYLTAQTNKLNTSSNNQAKSAKPLSSITVDEWDTKWRCIGPLKTANLTPYNSCVGLYRHVIDGETKYVGRAIELNNGGFRKRLSDYRREGDSARKHTSGRTINAHLDEITTYILVVGNTQEAVAVTCKLEGEFVKRYNPEWNKQINI